MATFQNCFTDYFRVLTRDFFQKLLQGSIQIFLQGLSKEAFHKCFRNSSIDFLRNTSNSTNFSKDFSSQPSLKFLYWFFQSQWEFFEKYSRNFSNIFFGISEIQNSYRKFSLGFFRKSLKVSFGYLQRILHKFFWISQKIYSKMSFKDSTIFLQSFVL